MKAKNGFTLIEVMVTVVILATGLTMIYRGFLLSLDHQRYMVRRLHADSVLDEKIKEVKYLFQEKGEAALMKLAEEPAVEHVVINNKDVLFTIITLFQNDPKVENFLQMDIGISWLERGHPIRLSRSVYISRY